MTLPPKIDSLADERPQPWLDRNFFRLLLAIVAAGLIPRLALGNVQKIDFDGWWHLFIAAQDRWLMVAGEWKWVAHPPLFYPPLRLVAAISHANLMLRSIGIACGTATGVVIGIAAAKIYHHKASALLAAAAYTFAWSMVDLDCDVRAYPLAILFVMLTFNAWVDWTADPAGPGAGGAIVRFGVFSSLAVLSEYYVFFFLAACLCILLLRFLCRPVFREAFLQSVRADWKRWLFSAASISSLCLGLFLFQMLSKPQGQYYLQPYLWREDSFFGVDAFLLTNFINEIGYFTPFGIEPEVMLALAVLLFLPAVIYFVLIRNEGRPIAPSTDPPLLAALLLVQLVILALAGEYPFGGFFRHQSIIAPFVLLTAFLVLDRVGDTLRSSRARHAMFMTAGMLVAASFAFGWTVYPWDSVQPYFAEYSQFRAMFPKTENVYTDHTSAMFFYGATNRAKWTFEDRFLIREQRITTYKVDDGRGSPVRILQDKRETYFDLTDPETYRTLAETLRHQGLRSATLFLAGRSWNAASAATLQEQMLKLAPLAGLECGRYSVGLNYVFAEFSLRDGH